MRLSRRGKSSIGQRVLRPRVLPGAIAAVNTRNVSGPQQNRCGPVLLNNEITSNLELRLCVLHVFVVNSLKFFEPQRHGGHRQKRVSGLGELTNLRCT